MLEVGQRLRGITTANRVHGTVHRQAQAQARLLLLLLLLSHEILLLLMMKELRRWLWLLLRLPLLVGRHVTHHLRRRHSHPSKTRLISICRVGRMTIRERMAIEGFRLGSELSIKRDRA